MSASTVYRTEADRVFLSFPSLCYMYGIETLIEYTIEHTLTNKALSARSEAGQAETRQGNGAEAALLSALRSASRT